MAKKNAEVVVTKEKKKREKTEKPAKVMYPGLKMGPDGEATVKLKEWPADFDPKVHTRLRKKDFENEAPFLIKRAEKLERLAKQLRLDAEVAKTSGSKGAAKKIKRAGKMAEQFKTMMADLAAEGVPVDEFRAMLLAAMKGKDKDAK